MILSQWKTPIRASPQEVSPGDVTFLLNWQAFGTATEVLCDEAVENSLRVLHIRKKRATRFLLMENERRTKSSNCANSGQQAHTKRTNSFQILNKRLRSIFLLGRMFKFLLSDKAYQLLLKTILQCRSPLLPRTAEKLKPQHSCSMIRLNLPGSGSNWIRYQTVISICWSNIIESTWKRIDTFYCCLHFTDENFNSWLLLTMINLRWFVRTKPLDSHVGSLYLLPGTAAQTRWLTMPFYSFCK